MYGILYKNYVKLAWLAQLQNALFDIVDAVVRLQIIPIPDLLRTVHLASFPVDRFVVDEIPFPSRGQRHVTVVQIPAVEQEIDERGEAVRRIPVVGEDDDRPLLDDASFGLDRTPERPRWVGLGDAHCIGLDSIGEGVECHLGRCRRVPGDVLAQGVEMARSASPF